MVMIDEILQTDQEEKPITQTGGGYLCTGLVDSPIGHYYKDNYIVAVI